MSATKSSKTEDKTTFSNIPSFFQLAQLDHDFEQGRITVNELLFRFQFVNIPVRRKETSCQVIGLGAAQPHSIVCWEIG